MGQRASTSTKASFTDVLPAAAQRAKPSTTPASGPLPPEASRPKETAVPTIATPPHALLQTPPSPSAPLVATTERDAARFAVPESVRKSHTLAQFERACSEILSGFLYVSNLSVAQDKEAVRRVGITHVVNCCKEVACCPADDTLEYLQLALRDGVQEDVLPFIPMVVAFLERSKRSGGRVLIHCHQGVSRSCAFAIAYVMYSDRGCGFQRAMALVKTQRAICAPNAAFLCQLLEWERELSLEHGLRDAEYGLYRLAPHAAYDPATLVLKLCYRENSRRKATVEATTRLWPKGIFVFIDAGTIVVWKGSQCGLPNGVEVAREHVQRMVRILAGETAAAEMAITVIESDGVDEEDGKDQFEYASELAWMDTASVGMPTATIAESARTPRDEPGLTAEETVRVVDEKPMVFLLEERGQWERLTNYDSDDLLASSVLLLVTPLQSYLWIGQEAHGAEANGDILRANALGYLHKACGTTPSELHIEHQDSESEAFWDAFEAGY